MKLVLIEEFRENLAFIIIFYFLILNISQRLLSFLLNAYICCSQNEWFLIYGA